jgi:hypothetical protein
MQQNREKAKRLNTFARHPNINIHSVDLEKNVNPYANDFSKSSLESGVN